jgi:hypothetical protein
MFSPELEAGKVRVLLPQWQLPSVDLWAITPTGRRTGQNTPRVVQILGPPLAIFEAVDGG